MKSKGRWSGDIAYIYARFCPEMDREAVRAMGMTGASPFMERAGSHWASIAAWRLDRRRRRPWRRRRVRRRRRATFRRRNGRRIEVESAGETRGSGFSALAHWTACPYVIWRHTRAASRHTIRQLPTCLLSPTLLSNRGRFKTLASRGGGSQKD